MKAHEVHEIYVQALPGLTPVAGPRDPKTKQSFPFTPGPCYLGYHSPAYQIGFDIVGNSQIESAIYVPWASDNFAIYLNGKLLATPRGQFSLSPSREERRPYLIGIPRDRLLEGTNHIVMVVTRTGCTPYVETAYFGPLAKFKAYEGHMVFLGHYLPIMTSVASILLAFLTFSLIPISGYSSKLLSLSVFMIAMGIRSYSFVWAGNGIEYLPFLASIYFIHYFTIATAAICVQIWSSQSARHTLWIGGIFSIFCVLLVTFVKNGDLYTLVRSYLNPLSTALLMGYIGWCIWQRRQADAAEIRRASIIASLFLSVEIYEFVFSFFKLRRFIDASYYLPIALIIAIAAHLILLGHRLYLDAETARKVLAEQVKQKEIEIKESYAKLHEQENLNAIHTERQRLIRDMHDGVGGHLVSLMLQLRAEDIPKDRLEQQIQAAIDDLRLIIDSMDSVGTSLDIALAIFRERMGPRLKAAGIKFIWNDSTHMTGDNFKPQTILHIYRILQEGVTNILKYAQATEVVMSLKAEENLFIIELSDNGKGLGPLTKRGHGRGINHMRKRAKLLGSELEIQSQIGEGTHLRFAVRSDDTPEPMA